MLESLLRIAGYWLLFLRFSYWIGLSFTVKNKRWEVYLAQSLEGLLLFGIFSELFQPSVLFPFHANKITTLLGFFLIWLGVGGAYLAQKELGVSWNYGAHLQAKKLVTTGLYRYIRHPIYTGIIISYVGSQVLAGSWLWVSCLFLLIPAYMQAKKEEKILEGIFRKQFIVYKKKTKLFIPFVW